MGSLVLTGDTSGSGTITVPSVAGTFTATIGSATGTHYPFTSGTAVASTSGTSIDFTGIPSWVKRVTVMFSGVSTNGTSLPQVQIGAGSVTSSGYACSAMRTDGSALVAANYTSGFVLNSNQALDVLHGSMIITLLGSNTWTVMANLCDTAGYKNLFTAGALALGGTLDRVRITTVNGTDTFDAGSINILYE